MKKFAVVMLLALSLIGCEPALNYTSLQPSRTPKSNNSHIMIYPSTETVPADFVVLGTIRVDDSGFTTNCSLDYVVECAIKKARDVGADAIQITKIKPPDLWSYCYRITASAISFDTSNWPRIKKTEKDFRTYYDENANSLNTIEGIWSFSQTGTLRHLQSGATRAIDYSRPYRIAIVKDTSNSGYDFIAVVLESEYPAWEPGFVKARFRKTVFPSIYEGKWYMGGFTERNQNFIIDETGLMKDEITHVIANIETKLENVFVKAYPPFRGKSISSSTEPRAISTGTGFAISPEGHIVTAYHIIKGRKIIKVYLTKGSFVSAKIIHGDPMNDLAVLKMEKATPSFLQVAPMRSAKTGDRVFTIGFPVSSVLGQEAKYTEGVVSSLSGLEDASSFLQISVPVQPGNSGGALVNEDGQVIGIITSTAAILPFIKESGTLPQNVNWAVKADYLRPLIELPKVEQKQLNREQLITHVKNSTFLIEAE